MTARERFGARWSFDIWEEFSGQDGGRPQSYVRCAPKGLGKLAQPLRLGLRAEGHWEPSSLYRINPQHNVRRNSRDADVKMLGFLLERELLVMLTLLGR